MVGDARRTGGVYSDNPNTMKTRAHLGKLSPEKKKYRDKKFAEYRSLRSACITRSSKPDYHLTHSRDEKLAILRIACKKALTNRLKCGKDSMGYDVEHFIAHFHDRQWLRRLNQTANTNVGAGTGANDFNSNSPDSVAQAYTLDNGPAATAAATASVGDIGSINTNTEKVVTANKAGQSTAPLATFNMHEMVDFMDFHEGLTEVFEEEIDQLQEEQAFILQCLSIQAHAQLEAANGLGLLLDASGF